MTAQPEPTGRLVLVRHGETTWSRSGQHTGLTDLAPTPHGQRDARALRPLRFAASLLLDAGALCVLEYERGVPAIRTWNQTPT